MILTSERAVSNRSIRESALLRTLASQFDGLFWELAYWAGFLLWCLLPTTKTPDYNVGPFWVNGRDLSVIVVAVAVAFLRLISSLVTGIHRQSAKSAPIAKPRRSPFPAFTVCLLIYLALSVIWNGQDSVNQIAMLYTLLTTFSAFSVGYLVVANRSVDNVRRLLWRLTVGLAFVGLIYTAQSLFSLGLRSTVYQGGEFGIQRVAGPLFGAATGSFIMLPALAFAIQEILRDRRHLPFKLGVLFALAITIFGLGSRAGLLTLGLFLFLTMLSLPGRQRLIVFAVAVIVGLTAIVVIFSKANPERLGTLEDANRSVTHQVAAQIILNRPLIDNLIGSGYGSYWSWYTQELPLEKIGPFYDEWKAQYRGVYTPYGRMLYHPHSVLLLLCVEGGVIGLAYFVTLWVLLLRGFLRGRRGAPYAILACGMLATGVSLLTDLYIFKSPALNAIWWTYFLGALSLLAVPARQPSRPAPAVVQGMARPRLG